MKLSRPGYRIENAKNLVFDTSINNNNHSNSSNSINSKLPLINTNNNTVTSPIKAMNNITTTTTNNNDILLSTNLFKKQTLTDTNPYSVYARNTNIKK